MIDKTYWKIAFACNPQKTYTELKCKFFSDPDFRNEVLDSIPEDKMKKMKETYTATSQFKNLTFEEWFDFVRRTGIIMPVVLDRTGIMPVVLDLETEEQNGTNNDKNNKGD